MAKKTFYRPTSIVKQYEIIEDFSKGIDTKHADSVLKDNVSRDINNFNVESGGVLSKRQGVEAIKVWSLIVDALNEFYKDNKIYKDGSTTVFLSVVVENLKNCKIIKSYNFELETHNVVSMYAKINNSDNIPRDTLVNIMLLDANTYSISVNDLLFDIKADNPNITDWTPSAMKNLACDIPKITQLNSIIYCILSYSYDVVINTVPVTTPYDVGVNINMQYYFDENIKRFVSVKLSNQNNSTKHHGAYSFPYDERKQNYTIDDIINIVAKDNFNLSDLESTTFKLNSQNATLHISTFGPLQPYTNPMGLSYIDLTKTNGKRRDSETYYSAKIPSMYLGDILVDPVSNADVLSITNQVHDTTIPNIQVASIKSLSYTLDINVQAEKNKLVDKVVNSIINKNKLNDWTPDTEHLKFLDPYDFYFLDEKIIDLPYINIDMHPLFDPSKTINAKIFPKFIKIGYTQFDIAGRLGIVINKTWIDRDGNPIRSEIEKNIDKIHIFVTQYENDQTVFFCGKYINLTNTTWEIEYYYFADFFVAPVVSNHRVSNPMLCNSDISASYDGYTTSLFPKFDIWHPFVSSYPQYLTDNSFSFPNITYSLSHLIREFHDKPSPPTNIYKPDPKTFAMFSYNLMRLNQTYDIENLTAQQILDNINITRDSKTHILSSLLINNFSAIPNVNLKYLTGQVSQAGSSTLFDASYKVYYKLLSLADWSRYQSSFDTEDKYISDYIKKIIMSDGPKTVDPANGFTLTLNVPTSDEYVLVVLTTNKAITAITSSADYSIDKTTINTIDKIDYSKHIPYLIGTFANADKSFSYKNQIFLYGESNTLFVSDVNRPTYFPLINYVELPIDQKITAVKKFFNELIIQTKDHQFLWKGNTPTDMKLMLLNDNIGCFAGRTSVNNVNQIFALTEDGIYATKSVYSMEDRMNVAKMDTSVSGGINMRSIPIDIDSCATMYRNKYYLNTPSTNEIWLYYNDFDAWTRYSGPLFKFENMYMIDNELYSVGQNGFNIYKINADEYQPGIVKGSNIYIDIEQDGKTHPIISEYLSKQVDFDLPDHDKKFKKIQIAFENTPESVGSYVTVWVNGSEVVDTQTSKNTFIIDPNTGFKKPVLASNVPVPNMRTHPQASYGLGTYDKSTTDNDTNQLHEIPISATGRILQFRINSNVNAQLNIKNFAFIIKVKKPRASIK